MSLSNGTFGPFVWKKLPEYLATTHLGILALQTREESDNRLEARMRLPGPVL